MPESKITVGLAQIAPAWLDRAATIDKVVAWIGDAAGRGCDLVAFGEALVPGYPFWVERTGGAAFESGLQKELFAARASASKMAISIPYAMQHAATISRSMSVSWNVQPIVAAIACIVRWSISTAPGPSARSIASSCRRTKNASSGHGLRTHKLGPFTVGGLNCWENWLPLPRAALYAQGEDLHVAIWPGNVRNTEDITRFIARESRSFVVSVSGLMRREDIDTSLPHAKLLIETADDIMANGGSCVAGPDGEWLLEPVRGSESLSVVEIDHARVLEERHSLDVVGHYSRPDVTRLVVNRKRQTTAEFSDDD
jgi:nitrilase